MTWGRLCQGGCCAAQLDAGPDASSCVPQRQSDEEMQLQVLLHSETLGSVEDKWAPLPRPLIIDSGAALSVIPEDWCTNYELVETAQSRAGVTYQVANGDPVHNMGQRTINALTEDGQATAMAFTLSEVSRALGSVSSICRANNTVVFDGDGSYIYNKGNGMTTWLRDEAGVYVLDLKVAPTTVNPKDLNRHHVHGPGR